MGLLARRAKTLSRTDLDVGAPTADLTNAVFRGVFWKAATRGVATVTKTAMIVVLARLLTPADYGVAGMALVVTTFVIMFTDPALGAALVQRPSIDEHDRSTVFWMTTSLGAALTVGGVAASGLVADFFGERQVKNLFIVTSLCFVVLSAAVVHRSLLMRNLAYRSLEIREMVSIVTGAAIAIAAAAAGFGPWSIIMNFVGYSVTSTVLLWIIVDWRPRFIFSLARARSFSSFSSRVLSASVLDWGNQNLDNALVGRFVGPAALGAYSIAYNTMLTPVLLIGQPLHQVLAPAYSRIQQDHARLERAWLRSKRVSAAVVVPALLALIVVAPDAVRVLYGNRWSAAVVPLQLLCIGAIANALGTLNWSVLQARGKAATLLRVTVVSSAVTWTAFAFGVHWGLIGVAASYALAKWLQLVPLTWMTTHSVEFSFWSALRAGGESLPAAIGAAGVGFAIRQMLLEAALPPSLRLVVVGAAVFLTYCCVVLVVAPSVLGEVQEFVRRRMGRLPAEKPI